MCLCSLFLNRHNKQHKRLWVPVRDAEGPHGFPDIRIWNPLLPEGHNCRLGQRFRLPRAWKIANMRSFGQRNPCQYKGFPPRASSGGPDRFAT